MTNIFHGRMPGTAASRHRLSEKDFDDAEGSRAKSGAAPFINVWEPHDWSPQHLMVWAEKWPSAALRDDITLPNGQALDLNTMLNKQVVIRFRAPNPFWVEPQQQKRI